MNTKKLLNIRLYNQLLTNHRLKEPHEIVLWMGAMQAQAPEMAKWAIGSRLENKIVRDINEAINSGKIIRTHTLRPTWHFISAKDVYWMSDLSKPRLKPIYRSYARIHKADESLIYQIIPAIEKILIDGKHLTKEDIKNALQAKGIITDDTHLRLAICYAEVDGIIVNGQLQGNKQTFTLLKEWVPEKQTLCKEEALECLAKRYFASHGPATIYDFGWWSGLSITECRQAIEMIKSNFICEKINGREFWMKNEIEIPPADNDSTLLLPPFDEYVVSYKDRCEIIKDAHYSKVMTRNGLFSPTIMINGEIVGSWKKTIQKKAVKIELSFFEKASKRMETLFHTEIKRLENFYSNLPINDYF